MSSLFVQTSFSVATLATNSRTALLVTALQSPKFVMHLIFYFLCYTLKKQVSHLPLVPLANIYIPKHQAVRYLNRHPNLAFSHTNQTARKRGGPKKCVKIVLNFTYLHKTQPRQKTAGNSQIFLRCLLIRCLGIQVWMPI